MLKEGLNRIRDLHGADIEKGKMGTDGTAANESQTGLQTGVAASEQDVTVSSADKTNTISYRLDNLTGTSNIYREFGTRNDTDSIDYDRVTFTGIEHTANDDIVITKIINYRNPE